MNFDDFFGSPSYQVFWQPDDDNGNYTVGHNGHKAILIDSPQRPKDTHISPLPSLKSTLRRCEKVMAWQYPPTMSLDLSHLRHPDAILRILPDSVEFVTLHPNQKKRETLTYTGPTGSHRPRTYNVYIPDLISILDGPMLTMWEKEKPPHYLSTESNGVLKMMTIKQTLGEIIRSNLTEYAEVNNRHAYSAFSVPLPKHRQTKS